jgi:hypothetical protein
LERDKADAPKRADNKPKISWGCTATLLAVVSIYFLISRTISPSDWVDVTVGPLPNGYASYCLIAEDSTGVRALPWYHSKVFPFTEDPFMEGTLGMGPADFDNDGFVTVSVQWWEAKRYGVLLHRRDDQWRLWWLNPRDLRRPSVMRFVFGGGKANVHLSDEVHAQVPPQELLERLGLTDQARP